MIKHQEEILWEILGRYREIEKLQSEINEFVIINRQEISKNPDFEDDYTESIESYYTSNY